MRVITYICWGSWIFWSLVFLGYALWYAPVVPLTPNFLRHLTFVVLAFWFVELFFVGILARHNPLYALIRRYVAEEYRRFSADFAALVGFGCFGFVGAFATLTSRNAFFYIGDSVVGVALVIIYAIRRRTVLDSLAVSQ